MPGRQARRSALYAEGIDQLQNRLRARVWGRVFLGGWTVNLDTDSIVYFIKLNGIEPAGTVKYGSGEFYSDEFDFQTDSPTQGGSIRLLADWMEYMEGQNYRFLSAEEVIDAI